MRHVTQFVHSLSYIAASIGKYDSLHFFVANNSIDYLLFCLMRKCTRTTKKRNKQKKINLNLLLFLEWSMMRKRK